ncbi:MAG: ribosome maturation factor RimM [Treponema sp.]|nr:ribosome maturation factor RimM [Treponema sp.]
MTGRFVVGLLGLPFGLDGRVRVRSLSGEEDHLLNLKTAVLRKNGEERAYTVEGAFSRPLSLKFAGIDSPEAAKTVSGAEIIAERKEAAPLREGEFYVEDLKGLKVYIVPPETGPETSSGARASPPALPADSPSAFPEGELIGEIADVIEGGGSFLAEIALVSGEKRLVPFRNEFFGSINLDQGRAELLVRWILE